MSTLRSMFLFFEGRYFWNYLSRFLRSVWKKRPFFVSYVESYMDLIWCHLSNTAFMKISKSTSRDCWFKSSIIHMALFLCKSFLCTGYLRLLSWKINDYIQSKIVWVAHLAMLYTKKKNLGGRIRSHFLSLRDTLCCRVDVCFCSIWCTKQSSSQLKTQDDSQVESNYMWLITSKRNFMFQPTMLLRPLFTTWQNQLSQF